MARIYNFSAGPATLPLDALKTAQHELLDWRGIGASVLEISHRGTEFLALIDAIEKNFRELLNVPDHYRLLFMHGGGQGQFSNVPMHFLSKTGYAAYAKTGSWSEVSAKEAERFGAVKYCIDAADNGFTTIPRQNTWQDFSDADYLYYVDNETVHGMEFNYVPDTGNVPLICDMSSNIFSRPVDIAKYGLIFACVQKNLGPAGLCIVIIRDDLLMREPVHMVPKIFDYRLQAENNSLVNTPSVFSWYLTGLVLDWIKAQGGVQVMAELAYQRSSYLYERIENMPFYTNSVKPDSRSRMNVVFKLKDETKNAEFLQQSKQAGLMGLKGHRYVGGMRASMYNAMPMAGVKALADFMHQFAKANVT